MLHLNQVQEIRKPIKSSNRDCIKEVIGMDLSNETIEIINEIIDWIDYEHRIETRDLKDNYVKEIKKLQNDCDNLGRMYQQFKCDVADKFIYGTPQAELNNEIITTCENNKLIEL